MTAYSAAITSARSILNDTEAPYTWSDADLLSYACDGVAQASLIRPDLFEVVGTYTCILGARQELAPAVASRIMEVYRVIGGRAVTEVMREMLDRFSPGWMSESASVANMPENWCRNPRSDRGFFVYPPAVPGLQLEVQYVAAVARATDPATTLPLGDKYFPALVDYIVGRAEMRDDEHANDQRAKQLMESFQIALMGGHATKQMTDREDGGFQGSPKVTNNG